MVRLLRSGDAEISYEVIGKGPDVVLLHPFPANHEIWMAAAELLVSGYRLILPDLRGHGDSGTGEGPATMEKHAQDVHRVCEEAGVHRAVFAGVSIGGYVLFEFWRQSRGRVAGFVLSDTRAAPDGEDARVARLKAAEEVEKHGSDAFIEAQVVRLVGATTVATRPDLVERVREMMRKMTVQGIAAVQLGMAMRPDSTPTLATINVPTLLMFGEEDQLTTASEGQAVAQQIAGSKLQVIPRAGHYAVFERHEDAGRYLRQWLDRLPRW